MQKPTVLQVLLCLALGGFVAGTALAAYEGVAFGVENYTPCGAPNLRYCRDDANHFRNALDYIGYSQTVRYYDSSVHAKDFTDYGFHTWGRDYVDPSGTDWADAVYFSGHGGRTCSPNYNSVLWMGESSRECSVELLPPSQNIRFADGGSGEEANILIMDSSQTMQYCIHNSGDGFFAVDGGGSGTQLTMLNGFHGFGWDSSGDPDDTYDYVVGAKFNGIGDDWVDIMTHLPSGSNNDECAVSVAFGSSVSVARNMYLNGGFKDFKDTGTHNWEWYAYVINCNPVGGEKLPSS